MQAINKLFFIIFFNTGIFTIIYINLRNAMAKVTGKVLRTFRDKHTGTRHIQGEPIEVVSQARLDEINSKFTYVEADEEKPKAAKSAKKADDASESETKND